MGLDLDLTTYPIVFAPGQVPELHVKNFAPDEDGWEKEGDQESSDEDMQLQVGRYKES